MKLKTLKLFFTIFLLYFSYFISPAQTVRTFAGKAYIGTGSYNGIRNNPKDSIYFSAPAGIDIDTSGRIYISNEHNIMMITGTNCKLVAGYNLDPNSPGAADSKDATGIVARFSNPAGICVFPSTNELYVADADNHQIRKVSAYFNNFTDPQVTTFAGVKYVSGDFLTDSTNALSKFNGPVGVAIADNGDVYIADRNNHCIRKISGGKVTTIGGKKGVQSHVNGGLGTSTFNIPLSVFLDNNFLYVADYGNNSIRKIDLSNNTVTDFITSGLNTPTDLCKVDNTWYITQQTCVKKFENNVLSLYVGSISQTGHTDAIGNAARFEYITAIAYSKKNKIIYLVDKGNNIIRTISPINTPVCNFTATNLFPTKGQTIILSSTSTKRPNKFYWTISPVNYSLLNNSKVTDSIIYLNFSQTGSYTIKLWVANGDGADSLIKNNYITVSSVIAIPVPAFAASKTNPIANEVISLIDQSANDPANWKWRISPLTFIYVNGTDSTSRIPNIKFTNGDNYDVTLIVSNMQGSAILTKKGYINVNLSSINTIQVAEKLTLYPNPCSDIVNLQHPLSGMVKVFNMEGRMVGELVKEGEKLTINLSEFPSGIYFITLQTASGIISQKLVIGK